jgi:acyl-CoA synthetase (AMP-forming)/AMP-acid ligase II
MSILIYFRRYLNDPSATAAAHDNEGYFITGDIARREGNNYFILGRASIDIIKSGGYKLSALDIEREILGLDYISEVMVVGVEDDEFGQRVAAAVTLKEGMLKEGLSLERLRRDLRERLAGYKMPTALRVLEREIPKSGTGKVQKKILGPRYFGDGYRRDTAVQVWERGVKAKL